MSSSAPDPDEVPPLIAAVLSVAQIEHRLSGFRYGELNNSGSRLLIPLEGRAQIELTGHTFPLTRGCVAWVAEAEWMRIQVLAAPWAYLSIRFAAPNLPTPGVPDRVRRIGPALIPLATDLRRAWDTRSAPASRQLRVHGLVSAILGRLLEASAAVPAEPASGVGTWWAVETAVRAQISRHYTLAELTALSGTHRAALELAAKAATGLTPMRRLRQIRMVYAQTLMRNSNLLLKEVAVATGYTRLHEFSRDYRRMFGLSPHKHRSRGYPDRPVEKP